MNQAPLTLSLDPGPERLWLNLPALRRTNTLVQGSTRAGKSYLVRWLCEQLFGSVQQLIFDVEGEYVSLTERFDYALFSAETQVKPDPEAAPVLMRRLLETGNSAIFDLSEMASPEQQRFTAAAAAELVRASPKEPRSVLVVIDEAQRLAPQAGQGEAASTTQIRDLANRGLKRGIALLLATQRHSSVDAGLRGALANLVVGGTPPGPDMKSSGEKLGFSTAERRQLASLRAGEFFFLGPAFGDPEAGRAVQLARAGGVQTRHLDAGEARVFTPPPASDAVQSLYDLLGAEEASGEQAIREDPEKPEAVKAGPAPRLTPPAVPEPVKKAVAVTAAPPAPVPVVPVPEPETALQVKHMPEVDNVPEPAMPAPSLPESKAASSFKPASSIKAASGLPADQARRLEAILAEFAPWPLTPVQLAALARVELTEPQGGNLVRALRRKGVADWDGERLTFAGPASARSFYPSMGAAEYRRRWKQALGTLAARLLAALAGAGEGGLTWRQWLDAAAYSVNSGGKQERARKQLLALGFAVQQGSRYTVSEAWPRAEAEARAEAPLLKIS